MPAADDDWRLTNQEEFLAGRMLAWRRWSAARPGSDHDHCEFCWAEFGDQADDEVVNEGWTTVEDSYHWVCPACFEDFRERFGWIDHSSREATTHPARQRETGCDELAGERRWP